MLWRERMIMSIRGQTASLRTKTWEEEDHHVMVEVAQSARHKTHKAQDLQTSEECQWETTALQVKANQVLVDHVLADQADQEDNLVGHLLEEFVQAVHLYKEHVQVDHLQDKHVQADHRARTTLAICSVTPCRKGSELRSLYHLIRVVIFLH